MNRSRFISVRRLVFLGLPTVLLVVFLVCAWWLLMTSSGANWVWGQVEDAASGAVQASRVDGDLLSGITVHNLEYLSDELDLSVQLVEIAAAPGWWPMSVQVSTLVMRDIKIVTRSQQQQVDGGNPETDIRSILKTLKLPFPVKIHAAELRNVTLQRGDEAAREVVESLKFQIDLDDRLIIDHLDLIAQNLQASLNGQLSLEPPFDVSVSAQGRLAMDGETIAGELMFPFRLESTGNVDGIQFDLASNETGLAADGELFDLGISGSGSATGLVLRKATITGPGVGMDVSGTLDWSTQLQAGVNLQIHQLDLSPWLPDWPAGKKLTGNLELDWSEAGLKIPLGNLTVAGTNLDIGIKADIDVEANSVIADINWRNLSWPLADSSPDFISPSGSLSARGSIDQWTATGKVDIELGDYPRGRFEIQGGGNRTSTRFTILDGGVLGGHVSGAADADWEDGLSWNASIRTRGINPEPLLPGWPGRLDAEVELGVTGKQQFIHAKLVSLQGQMRGIPISGHGGLSIEGDTMTFRDVELRTEDAVLQLDGATSDPAGATVKFNGYLPSVLLQGATGNVELEGRYSSSVDSSFLDVTMEALDLAWNGYSAKSVAFTAGVVGPIGSVPTFHLNASRLAMQDILLDELVLSLEPAGHQHRLNASMSGKDIAVNTTLTLEPENSQDAYASNWRGVFDELEVVMNQKYNFELLEPASLKWHSGSFSMGPVCVHEEGGAGLCVSSDYKTNGDRSLVADVKAVPLNYLRDLLDMDIHFEQFVEGRFDWYQVHGQAPTGGAKFRISAGRIFDFDENDVLTQTKEGRLEFTLKNGNIESGVLDIEFPGAGFVDVDFNVLDIIEDDGNKLQGRALVQLNDLNLIGQLVLSVIDDFDGQFESNIQLGGTLVDPSFDGRFKLSNGLVRYAPIGLKLENIEIEGVLEKRDQGSLKGGFQVGEGTGSIDGRLFFENFENMQLDVTLSGDDLLLINTGELKILTEADLRFGLTPRRMDINGHISIPSARLTPSNLVLEKVGDSEDLVIQTEHLEADLKTDEKLRENRIYGQVEVSFGDDVLIKLPGIETNLGGSVMFNWDGQPVPMANGVYELRGKVDMYGPTLQINNGHISFPDVVANNPLLNIKAEREIFGNTQVRSAGVQVIGTLKRPRLEAYTVPVTNEDRAWTLLVTGTDFDQAQGVGGFDVGAYIAPKLYVSYGISLFEDENVISARYDLKKGFGIKITSGQRETGLDVSYTIDR